LPTTTFSGDTRSPTAPLWRADIVRLATIALIGLLGQCLA
jgi:hypothetical protein